MKKIFTEILDGISLKENLIQLKTLIKEEEKKAVMGGNALKLFETCHIL